MTSTPFVLSHHLASKSEGSANGAGYDSQGQARSASPLGNRFKTIPALKGRNLVDVISAFQASNRVLVVNPGRRASRLPWAFISRAVGASFRVLDLCRLFVQGRLLLHLSSGFIFCSNSSGNRMPSIISRILPSVPITIVVGSASLRLRRDFVSSVPRPTG